MRASHSSNRSSESKSTKINSQALIDDGVTSELLDDKPVAFLSDPDEIVDPDSLPDNLKKAIEEEYGPDYIYEVDWTRKKVKQLNQAIFRPRENRTNVLAQICGPNCPFRSLDNECPYEIIGKPPIGSRCPLELKKAESLYDRYVESIVHRQNLAIEDVANDQVYHNMISNLVEIDLTVERLETLIAKKGYTAEVVTTVVQQTGDAFYEDREIPELAILHRKRKERDELIKVLVLSPEMEERYRKNKVEDNIHAKTIETLNSLMSMVAGKEIEK